MARHELKTWPDYFEAILRGDKTFEVRVDDRGGYDVGDVLALREWDPQSGYTKRVCDVTVRYVLRDPKFGVAPGYVVMGITLPPELVARAAERRRVRLIRRLDYFAVASLWASLIAQRAASTPVAIAWLVLTTILVGASVFARGRS